MPTVPPLAAFAHELRTPLHGMLGCVALLRTTALDAEQAGHVAALEEAARALLALADDALDLTRLGEGRLAPALAPCDPVAIAEGVCRTLAPVAAAQGLALAVQAAPDAPRRVHTDAGRVRQVLLNLVGNALRATRRGGVTVHVDVQACSAPAGATPHVVWAVADTGAGMSAERQAALFRAWETGGASGGAGLGLVLARGLADALGGSLTATSALGAGSTFTLAVPVAPPVVGDPGPRDGIV